MATVSSGFRSLVDENPQASVNQLLAELVPPREFMLSRFTNYLPHPEFPSQTEARDDSKLFADGKTTKKIFTKAGSLPAGIYLDGGFGVGKTHLLAAIWHEFRGKKAFGSFIAFTSLIGALGFAEALKALGKFELICIDEFELDDPGDTMMMSRLLNELSSKGVRFAATSNTPPSALGEGRFASSDFQREIHGIADRFEMLRIDGEDHRHRPMSVEERICNEDELLGWLQTKEKSITSLDDFGQLLRHLSTIHPSKYGRMIGAIENIGLTDCHMLDNQVDALRFVAFVDRAYEAQVKIRGTGKSLTSLFSAEYLSGGYRKKYLRAVSRLGAMSE